MERRRKEKKYDNDEKIKIRKFGLGKTNWI